MYKLGQLVKYGITTHRVLAYNPEEQGCLISMEDGWTWNSRTDNYPIVSPTIKNSTKCWWVPYNQLKPTAFLCKVKNE